MAKFRRPSACSTAVAIRLARRARCQSRTAAFFGIGWKRIGVVCCLTRPAKRHVALFTLHQGTP